MTGAVALKDYATRNLKFCWSTKVLWNCTGVELNGYTRLEYESFRRKWPAWLWFNPVINDNEVKILLKSCRSDSVDSFFILINSNISVSLRNFYSDYIYMYIFLLQMINYISREISFLNISVKLTMISNRNWRRRENFKVRDIVFQIAEITSSWFSEFRSL